MAGLQDLVGLSGALVQGDPGEGDRADGGCVEYPC